MPSIKQITTKLYKHYSGVADTRTSRDFFEEALESSFSVRPDQLWMYGDQIPRPESKKDESYKKIKNFKDGEILAWEKDESTFIPVLIKHIDWPLAKIDNGTDNSFKLVDYEYTEVKKRDENGKATVTRVYDLTKPTDNVPVNIIPFNFASDLYNYSLSTKDGKRIYFGVGDWQLDIFSGVLTFYGDVPEGVDHNNPPKLTFYQYIGGTGFRQDTYGFDGATLPIDNWHIDKGTYIFNKNPNNKIIEKTEDGPKEHDETIFETISRIANKVQDGFAGTYGWDGSDKNEGIALSLEKIIALEYTFTKDKVKGYDESADAEIGTLLSNKHGSTNAPLSITFASQGLSDKEEHILKVTAGEMSFDNGKAKTIKKGIHKLPNEKENGFIIVEISNDDPIPDFSYNVVISESKDDVVALLLYWNKETQEYLPFITKEEHDYNFGFSIVAANGKIPPSVKMDSAAISAYSDSITPDYYGPRNYSVTVAVDGEYSTKSADYIVKNTGTFYLDDIVNRIAEDFTVEIDGVRINTFKGAIFLRAGTYKLRNNLDLSKFKDIALVGEASDSVIITGDDIYSITYNSEETGLLLLKDITLNNIDILFDSPSEKLIIKSVASNGDLHIKSSKNNILVTDSSFSRDVIIENDKNKEENTDENVAEDVSIVGEFVHSTFGSLVVNASSVFINAIVAYSASFKDRKDIIVKSCFFHRVLEKPTQVQFRGCTVRQFATSINRREIPNTGAFPIFSKTNDQLLQYAKFANQFYYDEGKNDITLNIDGAFLFWKTTDKEGNPLVDATGEPKVELSCHIDSSQITVKDIYDRDGNYNGELTHTGETLEGALTDLYKTKADLVKGKVPLTELPDSVAYGGLLYIGSWAFDTNDGSYPTFEGTIKDHPHLSLDTKVDDNKLQPGWFWVVASSTQIDIDNPVSDQVSALQYTFDETGHLKVLASSLDNATIAKLEKLTKKEVDEILNNKPNPDSGSGSDDAGSDNSGSEDSGSDNSGSDGSGSDDSGSDSLGSDDSGSDDSGSTLNDTTKKVKYFFSTSEREKYLNYFKAGGLVFTAGDWVIWNGSFFEKLDRAYQDPVYTILPVYTTGNNSDSDEGRISWYWRTSRDEFENGWGLGALDLGKKTIGEAFDNINVELRRLQVKHPANISNITLSPIKEYLKTSYRPVKDLMISDVVEEAYDALLDNSVKYFRVETPRTEDWKNLIYFGDNGDITGYVDDKSETHRFNGNSKKVEVIYDAETNEPTTLMNISNPIDPYKNEFIGQGYWNGVNLDLGPAIPFGPGKHTFQVGVSNVSPFNPKLMMGVMGQTVPFSIKVIEPYELKNAVLDDTFGRTIIDDLAITNYEIQGSCSGIKSIKVNKHPAHIHLTYRIKNALVDMVNVDDDLVIKCKTNINEDLKTPNFAITKSIDGVPGFLDYYMLNNDIAISSSKVWTNLSYDAIIYDVYGREKEFKNIIKYNIRFDPTTETERVFSGNELYPSYAPGKRGLCGNAEWDSTKLLTQDGYLSELQKVGRNIFTDEEETTIAEYQWPSGIYKEFDVNKATDYSNVESGVIINEETYRFVTLTKFGNSEDALKEVFLTDNSGFTLTMNVAEDNLENWTCDPFSMKTNNIIIQAKIINPNIMEDDPSYTQWIDCNSPYDGFLTIGDDNGDPAMYAGSSTATVKRITFGRKVYSGKLIIRVGIKKDSNMKFKSITIGDLI